MTWVKLDDQFFANPKVLELSKDAKLLYLGALTHCAAQLTDGHVSPAALRLVCALVDVDRKHASSLVDAGLWREAETGYIVHDFLEYNPSSQQVKAKRRANAERQARFRERQSEDDNGVSYKGSHGGSNGVTNAATNDTVTAPVTPPPSPSPSPSQEQSTETEEKTLAPKPARERERDIIWDALSETVGEPATTGNRSNFGRVVQELKSANATPEQILRFPGWWRKRFPDAALTVNCYASKNHWGEFINSPPAPPPNIDDIKDPFMRALLRDAERTEASNGQREHVVDETWRDEIRLAESWQLGPGGGSDG